MKPRFIHKKEYSSKQGGLRRHSSYGYISRPITTKVCDSVNELKLSARQQFQQNKPKPVLVNLNDLLDQYEQYENQLSFIQLEQECNEVVESEVPLLIDDNSSSIFNNKITSFKESSGIVKRGAFSNNIVPLRSLQASPTYQSSSTFSGLNENQRIHDKKGLKKQLEMYESTRDCSTSGVTTPNREMQESPKCALEGNDCTSQDVRDEIQQKINAIRTKNHFRDISKRYKLWKDQLTYGRALAEYLGKSYI